MDFSGKLVLVTGASRGIGRAIAVAFAAAGARVGVHFHSDADAAAETIEMLDGDGHLKVQADLADPDQVRAMIDGAAERLGGLDILVNNAAVYIEHPIASVTYEQWQQAWSEILDTNLRGAANACWCVVPHMQARGGGRIVNVSSRGAFRGEPNFPAYAASKAGLNAMGQSLAQALAVHEIGIGTVAPGFVETDMARPFLDGPEGDAIRNQSPWGRVARPDEVAHAVLFLASEGAEFTSGTIIDVNGASYLRS